MVPENSNLPGKTLLVLLDTSASMKRGNLWTQARDKAQTILRATGSADRVAVYSFDRQLNQVLGFEQWSTTAPGERSSLAVSKIGALSPRWFDTHLGHALIAGAEILEDANLKTASGPRQIIVISDFQEGSHLESLQGYEWPKGIQVSTEAVKLRGNGNATIQLVGESDEVSAKAGLGVRVRVGNSADSKKEQFTLAWANNSPRAAAATVTLQLYVPPGQSRSLVVPVPAGTAVDRLTLAGDDEDFDNIAYVIPPAQSRVTVAYLGEDSGDDPQQPLYFLKRAFPETHREAVEVKTRKDLPDFNLANLVVADGALGEQEGRKLHEAVFAGKTVLFVLREGASAADLGKVLGADNIRSEEARVNNYAILGEIDFSHPVFAAFVDSRFSDFSRIHFWKYRKLDPADLAGARTLARFDAGDPAVLEIPAGRGRVFVLTSGWQPSDSQLALSTKFVPLLFAFLEQSGGVALPPPQYYVGDTVPMAQFGSVSQVRLPDGSESKMAAGETNFSGTVIPGIYEVASSAGNRRFAVNLDPSESRTISMAGDELESLGAPLVTAAKPISTQAGKIDLQFAELENRQKLWRWFIAAAILLLLTETWLAGWTSRKPAVPRQEVVTS
jgi:hypothetical protein